MSQPLDVVIAMDIASILSALVVVPQIAKAMRDPASVLGISHHSLAIQIIAVTMYGYTNWRLRLLAAVIQNAGALGGISFIWGMRLRVRSAAEPIAAAAEGAAA